ncbi:TIGR04086 family membrane protein [Fervidibacillus albus]|uniref:TIGR04086 family membrane protein n=1 Tax=Fervidibacillus albus TaxID=2980026 RepID=A0A9E8LVU5_9BACI|nr:TIGR04086 family membrane protein [Fervidibacillus albus]WAA10265.1 TIGR04086 family membrane protein [Fervidibacillus albus]
MDTGKMIQSVLYGLGTIYVIAALFSLLFSLLLRFTSLQENEIGYGITIISFIAIFFGGMIAGGKGKEKGWFLGVLTGLSYTLLNFLFQYLGFDAFFSMEQMVYYTLFIITAMIGGIIGVNSIGNRSKDG